MAVWLLVATWPLLRTHGRAIGIMTLGFVLCCLWDTDVYRGWRCPQESKLDVLRAFRLAGEFLGWVLLALGLYLIDDADPRLDRPGLKFRRGTVLLAATALAGAVANMLKILIRRQRPEHGDGVYQFRSILDGPFDSGGLGLPSGHTTVAFAGAFMLCRLHPRGTPVWLTLAALCGAYRVLVGAHYLSDAFAGAIVGYVTVALVWKWLVVIPDVKQAAKNTRDTPESSA